MDQNDDRTLPDPVAVPTVTVTRAAQILGISRAHAYEMANTGELPVIKLRGRFVVPTARLAALLGLDTDKAS
jgi:excisionase family DNA binding protein